MMSFFQHVYLVLTTAGSQGSARQVQALEKETSLVMRRYAAGKAPVGMLQAAMIDSSYLYISAFAFSAGVSTSIATMRT